MQVVEAIEIETARLEDVPEAAGTDLLKLDAQGFELTILEHAGPVLERALAVQTEVCFVPCTRASRCSRTSTRCFGRAASCCTP